MPRFTATIYKLGINPVVDPPERVVDTLFKQAGRTKGPIPVRGTVNGAEFRQTLVKYSGAWRLYVNREMLRASGANLGHTVKIEIEVDSGLRTVVMPESLRLALNKNKVAAAALAQLAPSRQKEIFRYIGSLKTAESIDKNVERVIHQLVAKKS